MVSRPCHCSAMRQQKLSLSMTAHNLDIALMLCIIIGTGGFFVMVVEEDLCLGLAKAFRLEGRLTVEKIRTLEAALGASECSRH